MTIFGASVSIPSDAAEANWLPPRLGAFGTVGGLIPDGFDGYLVIDHASEDNPEPYEAPKDLVAAVARIAERHTATPADAWFGLWAGYGWTSTRRLVSTTASWRERRRIRREDKSTADAVENDLRAIPQFKLPGREYYLVHGPVSAASQIEQPHPSSYQPPDLWWPADHAWFVATDTDLSWSYIGGSHDLIAEVTEEFPDTVRRVGWSVANAAVWD